MTHVVVGYPSLEATGELIETLADAGSDFIELQIPFSDPIADGPTIMLASEKAIENGANVQNALTIMADVSKRVKIPLLFMAYYNTIFHYGVEKFCKKAKQAGAYGLIVPDIPIDEEQHERFNFFCEKYGLNLIRVISPASTDERLKLNAKNAKGFVYCVSRYGVTGTKSELNPELQKYLKKVRSYFNIPLGVGFGISKREHIEALQGHADIAIVGSALIELLKKKRKKINKRQITSFIHELLGKL